jgi:hypothetical protein
MPHHWAGRTPSGTAISEKGIAALSRRSEDFSKQGLGRWVLICEVTLGAYGLERVTGFLALLLLRSAGLIPIMLLRPITGTAAFLTTIAMAGLGLGVDVRAVARTSVRVTLAVTASLIVLGLMSYALIRAAGIG